MRPEGGHGVQVGLGVALLLLIIAGSASIITLHRQIADAKWVSHSFEVMAQLERMVGSVRTAESDQRAYLIAPVPHRLAIYRAACADVPRQLASLQSLTSDNPEQEERLIKLRALALLRIDRMQHGIDLYDQQGAQALKDWFAQGKGTGAMRQLIALSDQFRLAEEWLLSERGLRAEVQTRTTYAVLGLSLLLSVVSAGLSLLAIRRQLQRRQHLEDRLRTALQDIEKSDQAKSAFLAIISHEIRTPINGVTGMIEMLLRTELTSEQRGYAGDVHAAAGHLLSLINDILDFSKIEAGRLELERVEFDPVEELAEAVGVLGVEAYGKGVALAAIIAEDLPARMLGDPTKRRQVVINLVANAVKFTSAGEVLLRASRADGGWGSARLVLEISDSGMGMSEEMRARLFSPFSQGESSTSRRFGGSGLGLAIAERLVRLMGGTIAVESRESVGSTFRVSLPLAVPPGHADARAAERGERVLAVDDHEPTRRSLVSLGARLGIRITAVATAAAARTAAADAAEAGQPFQVLIIDHATPGLPLAQELMRLQHAAARVALLQGAVVHASAAPAGVQWLFKPVRPRQLLRVVTAEDVSGWQPLADTEPSLAGRSLLVAEDNPINQRLIRAIAEGLGMRVQVVGDGRAAVDAVAGGGFDVVLMDCQMPELDGYEATLRIRASEPPGRRLPIIALTANALPENRARCLEVGMDECLTKPVSPQDIARCLASKLAAAQEPAPERLLADIARRLGVAESVAIELVDLFLRDAPGQLEALREAGDSGDAHRTGRLAHRMLSGLRALELKQSEQLCAALERDAASAGAQLPALVAALNAQASLEVARLRDARATAASGRTG
jgi:signal transduction histidine kinase/DNA-binding response OmpR family regulator